MTTTTLDTRTGLLKSLERWWWILRYHRPEQLVRRAAYRLRDRLRTPTAIPSEQAPPALRRRSIPLAPIPNEREVDITPADLDRGTIRLLNQSIELGRPVRESSEELSPLAAFHLHYHDYLARLIERREDDASQRAVMSWLGEWLDRHETRRDRVAWHPYCISRRIPAWGRILLRGGWPDEWEKRLRASLAQQTEWLSQRLEKDVGGNHLWENARALVTAGSLFEGERADAWWSQGSQLLDYCLRTQFFPWVEHFERSPGYQSELADGLVDVADWADSRDRSTSHRWADAARRMHSFLDQIRHPDGSVPLFGDSTRDQTTSKVGSLPAEDCSGWVGEYYVHRRRDHQLIFDAGDMGPDDLPAHAHADLLGYELSAHGRRVIVDRGVFTYSGPKRERFRGAAAHNVLSIDGRQLADTWSSFRLGRRGHVTERASGRIAEGRWVRASHDAYRYIGVPRVTRVWFLADSNGPWFCIDVVQSRSRLGSHELESRVHLMPGIEVEPTDEGFLWRLDGSSCCWEPLEATRIDIEPAWHSERYSMAEPAESLVLRSRGSETCAIGWSLGLDGCWPEAEVRVTDSTLELSWNEGTKRRRASIPWRDVSARRHVRRERVGQLLARS